METYYILMVDDSPRFQSTEKVDVENAKKVLLNLNKPLNIRIEESLGIGDMPPIPTVKFNDFITQILHPECYAYIYQGQSYANDLTPQS